MAVKRYPRKWSHAESGLYDRTSKTLLYEVARSFALRLTGEEDREEAIAILKHEIELLSIQRMG